MIPIRDDSRPANPWWFRVARGAGTDQTLAIRDAVALCTSFGGGTVFIPAGLYLISAPLILSSNIRITGAGRGATILRATGTLPGELVKNTNVYALLAAVDEDNVVVEHLTIDNFTNAANSNGCIFVPASGAVDDYQGDPCTNCVVQDIEVSGTPTHTYQIWSMRGERIKFLNNYVNGNNEAFPPAVPGQEGIEAFGGTDVLIEGNTVRNIGNAGIAVISAVDFPQTFLLDIRVIGNRVESSQYGIFATTANGAGGPNDMLQTLFQSNQINGSYLDGIRIQTPIAGTLIDSLQVLDNQIGSSGEIGINLVGVVGETAVHRGIRVAGNIVEVPSVPALGGITVVYLNDVTIDDNVVQQSAFSGIWAQLTTDVRITNNLITAPNNHGIVLDTSTDSLIESNTIKGHQTGDSGILVVACARGRAINNTFDRTITDEAELLIDSASSRWEMRGNRCLYVNTSNIPLCSNSGAYPRNVNDETRMEIYTTVPVFSGTGVHAAVASNAANPFPGPFTAPTMPRTIAAQFQASYDGGNINLTGIDQFGRTITDTIVANPGGFAFSTKVFAIVTAASKTTIGATANTVTLGPGTKLGARDRVNTSGNNGLLYILTAGVPTIQQATIDGTYSGFNPAAVAFNGETWMFVYPSFAND